MRRPLVRVLGVVVVGGAVGAAAFAMADPSMSSGAHSVAAAALAPSEATAPPPPSTTTTTAPTTTVPATTTTTEPPRGWLTIHGTGDTNFDPDYIPNFRTHGYAFAFGGLEGIFQTDDLTVVNLECSPSPLGSPFDKAFTFRCDHEALPVMLEHGVDVANLANNHAQDFGTEAMLDGRRRVEEAGIAAVGVGANLDEATTPAIFEIDGWKVAVLGMGGVVPWEAWLATEERPGMASGDDIEQMAAAVAAADAQADLVVVSIHWGWELETEPRADDRERAEAMVAAGADVVFGHHAHRLGAMEMIDGRPVFWTLGNFIWPRLSDAGATTAVARAIVSPEGRIEGCLIPAFIERSGQPVLTGEPECAEPES